MQASYINLYEDQVLAKPSIKQTRKPEITKERKQNRPGKPKSSKYIPWIKETNFQNSAYKIRKNFFF